MPCVSVCMYYEHLRILVGGRTKSVKTSAAAGAGCSSIGQHVAGMGSTARAGNRHFSPLSALWAHTKSPYKMDFHREKLRNAKGA